MSDLRERLATVLANPDVLKHATIEGTSFVLLGSSADAILAADPALARRYELGEAWEAAGAALPEGWRMGALRPAVGFNGRNASNVGWTASAYPGQPATSDGIDGYGPTATAALLALAARLREGA